jgi:hypothetical protein
MRASTKPQSPARAPEGRASEERRVGPFVTWFAVLGGVAAWATHLLVAWSVMEVSCLVRYPGYDLQHGGKPSHTEYAVAYGATVIPWLVAALALVTCLRLRVLVNRLDDDVLAKGRLHLLVVIGLFLDAMMLAAITGGGIALSILRPC